jgi:biopolymer transport protein ExbB
MMNILTTNPQGVTGDLVEAPIDSMAMAEQLANESVAEAEQLSIGFWDLFMSGGWLMWVLVLLAAIMIFIFVERFLAIRKATRLDNNFMNRIRDLISDGNINAAVDLCRRTDSPVARMIEKGIERIGRPMGDIQTSIENVANVEVAKLEAGLPWLASISGGAPMIGYLGTVVGMVQVFIDMSANQSGAIELGQLSAGMYVAMVTTVGGLLVGIPAYFAHNYLVARIEKLIFRMEATTIAFMDILNQPVQK